jgi:molybdate transport system substrate-binding protein
VSDKNNDIVRILSTGAPKTGVSNCATAYGKQIGRVVEVSFVTAPELRRQVEAGEVEVDIIVSPIARMDGFEEGGHVVAGARALVGSVKAGVVVRDGAAVPDISSTDSLKAAILGASSVVYNEATSGQYIAQMMENLGIADAIADKVIRVPNGAAVMAYLAESVVVDEIGFGQLTEIGVQVDKGVAVKLVGPLPPEVENITTYVAGVFSKAADAEVAAGYLAFLETGEGRGLLTKGGLVLG